MDDPDSWKTVRSDREGKDVVLNDEELDIIRRLQEGEIPDAGYNPYEPTVEFFTSKTEVMPLSAAPEPKRRFVPSKWEHKKVDDGCIKQSGMIFMHLIIDYENCACHSTRTYCAKETQG